MLDGIHFIADPTKHGGNQQLMAGLKKIAHARQEDGRGALAGHGHPADNPKIVGCNLRNWFWQVDPRQPKLSNSIHDPLGSL